MPEATICLNYGFDAVATWIHGFNGANRPSRISRGLYGVDVGIPRILDLHERLDLPGTVFAPGHTLESFPDRAAEIVEHGFDVQCHGWKHKGPTSFDSAAEERADIERAVATIEDLTSDSPIGYRAPTGDFTQYTLDILRDLDFEFDSSQLGNDFSPYFVHEGYTSDPNEPFERGTPTDIVELPWNHLLVDFMPFTPIWSNPHRTGYGDEYTFFDRWYEMFDWMHTNTDNGVFMPLMHPQIVGQIPRLTQYEEFLTYAQDQPEVDFTTMTELSRGFKDNPAAYG